MEIFLVGIAVAFLSAIATAQNVPIFLIARCAELTDFSCHAKRAIPSFYASSGVTTMISASTKSASTGSSATSESSTMQSLAESSTPSTTPITDATGTPANTDATSAGSSSTSPPTQAASVRGSSSPPTGAIVGGVLGGLAMVCITVVAVFWMQQIMNDGLNPEMQTGGAQPQYGYYPDTETGQARDVPPAYGLHELEESKRQRVVELEEREAAKVEAESRGRLETALPSLISALKI
ncbi:hypothetical protein K458DRAFT_388223 [Lentithecium fluviatile CBS 122367]|uniref:Mid2 domain-containing protein n=1 Tax=Lentithecium fluviatile CBS 122367 TaxID=1168545 RepID=A0A6G1J544_9PLEO|nr:hypothetical protein K458DRAFT_388223 [Lentithecium fluviatile CBS 122367]